MVSGQCLIREGGGGKCTENMLHAVEAAESALAARPFFVLTSALAAFTLLCSVATVDSRGGSMLVVSWVSLRLNVATSLVAAVVAATAVRCLQRDRIVARTRVSIDTGDTVTTSGRVRAGRVQAGRRTGSGVQ